MVNIIKNIDEQAFRMRPRGGRMFQLQKEETMIKNNRTNEQASTNTRSSDSRDHADDAAVLAALQSLDRAVERIVRETQPVLA